MTKELMQQLETIDSIEVIEEVIARANKKLQTLRELNGASRRNTLEQESQLFNRNSFLALEPKYKPDFDKTVGQLMFLDIHQKKVKFFKKSLSTTERFGKQVQILEKGVVLTDFLSVNSCNSLMNAFLQAGNIDKKALNDGNVLNAFSGLMQVWGGEALSFRITKSNVMLPYSSKTPSEIAFYKLEKKHIVFKTLAEELGVFFKQIYELPVSVSLSMRYLVANQGGNPIHVDAWEDSILKDNKIYINQQFSLFLSAPNEEKFVVFNNGTEHASQSGVGSLMGFNPTLKHHHPTGNGSWILIIEAILMVC